PEYDRDRPMNTEPSGQNASAADRLRRAIQRWIAFIERHGVSYRTARILAIGFAVVMLGIFFAGAGAIFLFYHFSRGLPDYHQLATYDPPVMTRVYAGDGRLIQEYAIEGRVFVPISAIPKRVSNAFIASEDQRFYSHPGIDVIG